MKCRLLFSNRFEKPKVRWQKIKNITANLGVEPITLHPTKRGYRNNKNKMKNKNKKSDGNK